MARAGHNAIITTSSISQMRALISKPHATEVIRHFNHVPLVLVANG